MGWLQQIRIWSCQWWQSPWDTDFCCIYILYIYRIIMTPNSIAWLDPIFGKLNPITKPYCYRHNLRKSNYCTWWYVQLNPINFPNLDLLEPAPVAELTMAFLAILAASANLPQSLGLGRKPRFVKVLCLVSSHQNTSLFLVVQVFSARKNIVWQFLKHLLAPLLCKLGTCTFPF